MNKDSPRVKSRKLWDKHGSWLILVVLLGGAFNGGSEWMSYKMRLIIADIVQSHVKERDDIRARARALSDRNQELARQLGPSVEKAEAAARLSSDAVLKADKAVEKVNELIQRGDEK